MKKETMSIMSIILMVALIVLMVVMNTMVFSATTLNALRATLGIGMIANFVLLQKAR